MIIEIEDYDNVEINDVEFNSEEKYFSLKSSDKSLEFNFNFISNQVLVDFEHKEFQFHFLQNNFLNAENDVFQVCIEKNRIGWIFPLQSVINLENDYADNEYFNRYRYITYKFLLSKIKPTKKLKINNDSFYSLTDLYDEDCIILCISNETLNESFEIDEYIPSLANYGYFLYSEFNNNNLSTSKNYLIQQNKGLKKIKIKKSNIDINEHNYLSNIYKIHLKNTYDKTLKFFLLYQVIEFLIEKKFDKIFEKYLAQYTEKIINKNDFKENLNQFSKERSIIKRIVEETNIDENIRIEFTRDASMFLNNFTKYEKTDLGDYIYDIRNLIVHRYRDVDILDIEQTEIFESITNQLERIVNDSIINYSL